MRSTGTHGVGRGYRSLDPGGRCVDVNNASPAKARRSSLSQSKTHPCAWLSWLLGGSWAVQHRTGLDQLASRRTTLVHEVAGMLVRMASTLV
jgi:hypothetical protein